MKKVLTGISLMVCLPVFLQAQITFYTSNTCEGDLTILTGNVDIADSLVNSWNWDLDNDGFFDDDNTKEITKAFSQANSYSVGLQVLYSGGLADTVYKNVVINPLPEMELEVPFICEGNPVNITANASIATGSVTQFKWDYNNDSKYDAVTTKNTTTYYYSKGSYKIKTQAVSDKGCTIVATAPVNVYTIPVADFTIFEKKNGEVELINDSYSTGDPVLHYAWDFGNGISSITKGNADYTYDSSGSYVITLIAVSEHLCRDTVKKTAVVTVSGGDSGNGGGDQKGTDNVFILTPNGDSYNDELIIDEVQAGKDCELKIFNRWNELVFSSDSYDNKWKGTKDGNELSAGAYFYILRCGDQEETGNINIIK